MRQGENFQMKCRKRINDKCHREKTERLVGIELVMGEGQQGQEDKEYRGRAIGKDNDIEADVSMRGRWSTCCTCKLIKQRPN